MAGGGIVVYNQCSNTGQSDANRGTSRDKWRASGASGDRHGLAPPRKFPWFGVDFMLIVRRDSYVGEQSLLSVKSFLHNINRRHDSVIPSNMSPPLGIRSDDRIPVSPPPPRVVSNFDHPESRDGTILATNIAFMTVSAVVLLLRLYTRRFIVHVISHTEYLIIIAHLLATGFSVATILLAVKHGDGVHVWDIPLVRLKFIMQMSVVQSTFLWLAFMFAKLSILVFYLRLSPYRGFRISVYVLIGVITAYGLISAFYWLFACQPIEKFWRYDMQDGSCIDLTRFWYSSAAINSATDFAMLVLPAVMLWPAPIPRGQKIGVMLIFMTGALVFISSLVRVHYLVVLRDHPDRSWLTAHTLWGVVEIYLGLICASLPHFKPLVRYCVTTAQSYSRSRNFPKFETHSSPRAFGVSLPSTEEEDSGWNLGEGNKSNAVIRLEQIGGHLDLGGRRDKDS